MRYALVYGAIAGAIVIAVITIGLATGMPSHASSEIFGYLVMLVALSLIFVGIKRYRDVEGGGVIKFGRAFAVGAGTAAVAAIVYVIGWETFLATSGGDFMAQYTAATLQRMQDAGAAPAEVAAKAAEMRGVADMYRNPLFRVGITFTEIFPVGLIVALISAAILRNPRVLPARATAARAAR